jgi:catalase
LYKFNQEIKDWVNTAYKYYKPIGIASTANSFVRKSDKRNLAGVVFVANNPNFLQDFIKAIAKQRFWERT